MYKISIVIPIFNAEKYLSRTINSVINQTIGFNNIDLILVDDNSSDKSKDIILNYSEKYDNINFIFLNKNHGAPGFARNIGIKNAVSNYVMFLDSDDELKMDLCEKLVEIAILEDADVVCCDSIICDSDESYPKFSKFSKKRNNNEKFLVLENNEINSFDKITTHGKLIKKEILIKNDIKFPDYGNSEDFVFSTKLHLFSNKLVYIYDYCGYYWYMNNNSISHKLTKEYCDNTINASYMVLNILKNKNRLEDIPEIFKFTIDDIMMQCFRSDDDFSHMEYLIKKLYQFEKDIDFKVKPNELWERVINFFIIHNLFKISIFLIKIVKSLKKSNFLMYVYRKIY